MENNSIIDEETFFKRLKIKDIETIAGPVWHGYLIQLENGSYIFMEYVNEGDKSTNVYSVKVRGGYRRGKTFLKDDFLFSVVFDNAVKFHRRLFGLERVRA